MIAMQVARIIARFMVFLNLTGEDLLDLDASVDAMQDLADGLEQMAAHDPVRLAELEALRDARD